MNSFVSESLVGALILLLVALGFSSVSESSPNPLPENTIFTLQDGKQVPLVNPGKAFWDLKNDKTERPGVGKTESTFEKKAGHVFMRGKLASLDGSWGKVGFSLIETAITRPIQRSEGLVFKAQGTPGAWFSVLVKDRQAQQPEGTLTFQWDFEANGTMTEYIARWEDFVPKIRGKKVSGFELDLFSVHTLSLQISRSQQKEWYETVPLEFELEL